MFRLVATIARAVGLALLALAAAPGIGHAAAAYAFGPDAGGVGRVFTEVSGGVAGSGVALGDGSVAYNGGLVYRAMDNSLYAITNDGLANSTLVSFGAAAPASVTPLASLGQGFYGGLALDASASMLYAIASDGFGGSTLFRMGLDGSALTPLGMLASGGYGGLAFDDGDGRLYALGADAFGVIRQVERIDLSGPALAQTMLFSLGDGSVSYNGGLAHDTAAALFYAIGNDPFANSMLVSFDLTGAASLATIGAGLGQGYVNAGLALTPGGGGDGDGTVPEPPMLALLGLAFWAARRATLRRPRIPVDPATD